MSISTLPLSYCTNVHPGRSVAEVEAGLDRYTVEVARRLVHAGLAVEQDGAVDAVGAAVPQRLARQPRALSDLAGSGAKFDDRVDVGNAGLLEGVEQRLDLGLAAEIDRVYR